MGFLPWEKWLPPYIFGPLICLGSIYALVTDTNLATWEIVVLPLAAVMGAWGTWVWFSTGRNIFDYSQKVDPTQQEPEKSKSDKT